MDRSLAREMRLIKWAADLQDADASGLGHRQWCELNNISYSTFKYRVRMLNQELSDRKEASEETALVPKFTEIPVEPFKDSRISEHTDDLIYVELPNVKIKFPVSSTPEQMKTVLEALTNA